MLHKFLTKKETYTRLNTYPHTYNNFRPHIRAGQMYIQICHNTCLVQKQTHTLCQNCAMVCSAVFYFGFQASYVSIYSREARETLNQVS